MATLPITATTTPDARYADFIEWVDGNFDPNGDHADRLAAETAQLARK